MRWIAMLALALALGPAAGASQEPGPPRGGPGRMEAMQERRAELERQIRRQFLVQVGRRLELSEAQRERLHGVLEEGAEARRALAAESRDVRRDLMRAVRDEDTPAPVYQELLGRIHALREREQALEEREDEALAGFLDARQQAVFLMMRMQLNDRIRRMQGPGAGRGPGGL